MTSQNQPAHRHLGWAFEGFDWYAYIEYRPVYPPSFYSRIYDHHSVARPGNKFDTAHDEGAGAGIVSEKLAEKFNHVIISEPNGTYLKIAEHRLSALSDPFPAGRFSYLAEGAEKTSVPAGSVDVITICEAIHWTDMNATVAEAARQLKSGGTFCAIWYNVPKPVGNKKVMSLWDALHHKYASQLVLSPDNKTYHRAVQNLANGLDCIGFDEEIWEGNVERWFTNCKHSPTEGLKFPTGMDIEPDEERVGKSENRVFIEDDREWMSENVDYEWLQKCALSFSPWLKAKDEEWKEIKDALGDEKITLVWSSVQIIATRK